MSYQRPLASERLPLRSAVFPRTFFADPTPVRPLKIHLHRDLNAWRQAQGLDAVRRQLQAGLTSAEWRRRVDEQKKARTMQPTVRPPVAGEAAHHLEEAPAQKHSRGRRR